MNNTIGRRKLMVNFADKNSTIGFCSVSCYCIVVVKKQIGFHGNAPPFCKHPLIKAALNLFQPMQCRIFLITRRYYCWNALHAQNSELEVGYHKFTSRIN